MADDIIIKFRADNKQIVQALKELSNLQKKVTKQAQHQTKVYRQLNAQLKKTSTVGKQVAGGMLDITNSGRLLNNTFATMRSKLLLVSFAFGIVTAAISRNIEASDEQEKSVNRLILTFGAQGRALDEYSNQLQETTGFADENINTMMSLFGAFGANVEQTKLLSSATMDLATAHKLDLTEAAMLVSKSFASSTNALSRYSYTLDSTAEPSEKIAALTEQITSKFGGISKAMMQTSGGPLKRAKNSFGDLRESLGKALALGFNPIIDAVDRFNKAMHGGPIRLFTELVLGLTIAFSLYHLVTKSIKGITAIATAIQSAYAASLAATAVAGQAATFSLRAFMATLTTMTGGLAALIFVVGASIAALLEWSGLMKETSSETTKADNALAKYKDNIKKFSTGNGREELDKFYAKLREGNELLQLQVKMLDADFKELFQNITLPTLPDAGLLNDLAIELMALSFTVIPDAEKALKEMIDTYGEHSAEAKKSASALQTLNDRAEELGTNGLNVVEKNQELIETYGSLSAASALYASEIETMNQQFKDNTGMSDEFFDQFIEGSGIMEAIQTGLITSNAELLAVLQENVTLKGALMEADDAEAQSIIKAIVLRESYVGTLKKENAQAKKNKQFKDLDWKVQLTQLGQLTAAVGAVFSADKDSKLKGAKIARAASIIDTAAAVAKASPNWVKMATIAAKGAAQVVKINQQIENIKGEAKDEMALGGLVGGRPHSQGGTIIEAERGEYVMRKDAVDSIGVDSLTALNEGRASDIGGNITINVSGNVLTQDYVEGELAESIKEAIRRGGEFGLN